MDLASKSAIVNYVSMNRSKVTLTDGLILCFNRGFLATMLLRRWKMLGNCINRVLSQALLGSSNHISENAGSRF